MEPQAQAEGRLWTLVLVSVGLFMVVLDNLVVNVALPSIHNDFGASVQALEWTVNAYVLAYGVMLLTGAALGDRFGRRRMFVAGISLFTAASAAAALAPSADLLIAARAIQGIGAAIVTPLTLTLIAGAFPPEKRGIALGVWSGISGVAVALGRVDRAAREHPHAAHEPRPGGAADEQHLERLGPAAQQDHRRRLARHGLLAVGPQLLSHRGTIDLHGVRVPLHR